MSRKPLFYAYGRHSTDKQALTEEVQKAQLQNYWRLHLEPKGVGWGGWLYDKAQSASKPLTDRVSGRELWLRAQPGDHVGWAKLDRAFRSVRDGSHTMGLFKERGIFIHSIDLSIDTSTPMGGFVLHVLLAFSELERQYASIRTKEALATLRSHRLPHLAAAPIGWKTIKVNGKTKRLEVHAVERANVTRWYALYGCTMRSRRRVSDAARGAGTSARSSVRSLLTKRGSRSSRCPTTSS